MTPNEKIDAIFAKVSKIETAVALINERYVITEKWKNTQDGRMTAIEDVVDAYKIERAKLIGIAVASGSIFTIIGSLVIWITGWFQKH